MNVFRRAGALALGILLLCVGWPAIAQIDPNVVGLPGASTLSGKEYLRVIQNGEQKAVPFRQVLTDMDVPARALDRIRRIAQASVRDNAAINPVVVSGGGAVTVAQASAAPAGTTSVGNLSSMLTAGTLPVRTWSGDPVYAGYGSYIRAIMPKTGGNSGFFEPAFEMVFDVTADGASIGLKVDATSPNYRLIINRQYVGTSNVPTVYATAAGSTDYLNITFANRGKYTVIVEGQANAALGEIWAPPSVKVRAGSSPRINVIAITDSYGGATGASYQHAGVTRQMALRLGWNVVANVLGGTGYNNPGVYGANGPFCSADRLKYMTAATYDVVWIVGGINDAQASYAPTVQASVTACLQAIRTAQPRALILTFGAWAGSTGPSTGTNSITDVENQISAAVTAFADPLVKFVPVSTATPPWFAGIGRQITFTAALSSATSGTLSSAWAGTTGTYTLRFSDGTTKSGVTLTNGSSAVSWSGTVTASATASAYTTAGNVELYVGADGTHPTEAGHNALGDMSADAILNALNALTSDIGVPLAMNDNDRAALAA